MMLRVVADKLPLRFAMLRHATANRMLFARGTPCCYYDAACCFAVAIMMLPLALPLFFAFRAS